ncbi:type VII secretion protein EccB [Kineosporia sp. NBRC 101677]|uniref:type VII secretion protein EccB n=1 Tax=Kineosporia sp. NBRC 101677 TaxID=3032197 RepID=UPI00249FA79C|nr:type VII secretion protein EccB [Kineosporia sp. NBRC 101677]GLY20166.1 type VII secretion protein EccB [Kineosporia sp. NBRC 101677]
MQSRKDQVQAHMFVMGRLSSGLLRLEPDGLDQPVTRTSRGALGGILVAALVCLVVALFGFVVPGGNTKWQKSGTLVLVEDTGARYLSIDGVLHPVHNLTSARLLAGGNLTVSSVKSKSLREAPRGPAVGVAGAPDSLPAPENLDGQVWTACATWSVQATGIVKPGLSLVIGAPPQGTGVNKESAIAVAGPDGHEYLLWNGSRLRLRSSKDVRQAIGAGAAELPPVSAAFLGVVPAGPDLGVPVTPRAGQAGPTLAGQPTRIGQLFADSRQSHYLLTSEGLVALTPLLFALYRADSRTQAEAYGGQAIAVKQLGPGDVSQHLNPEQLQETGNLPATVPEIVSPASTQALCAEARMTAGGTITSFVVTEPTAPAGSPPEAGSAITPSCLPAQYIQVDPGHGVLAADMLPGGTTGSAYHLVTDSGVKYALASEDAMAALGYAPDQAMTVPGAWLNLLPTGPVLDDRAHSQAVGERRRACI